MAVNAGQRITASMLNAALAPPETVSAFDNTTNSNISSTAYIPGTPEVGATFVAPSTGRVLITTGGGVRNNASNDDRVIISPQVFLGSNSGGTEVLAPAVASYGIGSGGGYTNDDYQYLSRTALLAGLTPGATYYARTMHACLAGTDTTVQGTADIAARQITVAPAS